MPATTNPPKPRGRAGGRKPKNAVPREYVTLYLDPDVAAFLRGQSADEVNALIRRLMP